MIRGKLLASAVLVILLGSLLLLQLNPEPSAYSASNPLIADMISQMSETGIYDTVFRLQNFATRAYGHSGNAQAAEYIYDRLESISELTVEYEGGSEINNVVATLPGTDGTPDAIYVVGAHYDSISSDPYDAPGACDDGAGVAIVIELARIMSQYRFNHTLKFACWNREEGGLIGSTEYAHKARSSDLNVSLYFNFDSTCYDPYDRLILDIMYNSQSAWVKDMLTEHNVQYDISFALTYNAHGCGSDYVPFWDHGYTAVMTHEEDHGPAHTPQDTVDKVSTGYARKNGQLGMSLLARLAEVQLTLAGHDVEVSSAHFSKSAIGQGFTTDWRVGLRNMGEYAETFSVAVYANAALIAVVADIALGSGALMMISSVWDTSGWAYGNYTIKAVAESVPGETDTADNVRAGNWAIVTIRGDVDGDSDVDIVDVVSIAGIYASKRGSPIFRANSDIDSDDQITILDIVLCTSHYGGGAH